jgi:hypothetical protein
VTDYVPIGVDYTSNLDDLCIQFDIWFMGILVLHLFAELNLDDYDLMGD